MRLFSILKLAAAVAPIALAAAPALAGPTNLGFESHTLAGWTTNGGDASTQSSISNSDGGEFAAAAEGDLFGVIGAGLDEDVFTTLSQSFTLTAGSTISGYAGFLANDYLPYNDSAYLKVNNTQLLFWDVAAVGDFGASGWNFFNFIAPTDGVYTLELGVANHRDNGLDSQAVIDGVQVSSGAVPEAASWAMMVLGFGLAGATLRTRRRAISFG